MKGTKKISEFESGLIFFQRSVYLSSLAMHVQLNYFCILVLGSDMCKKKVEFSSQFSLT